MSPNLSLNRRRSSVVGRRKRPATAGRDLRRITHLTGTFNLFVKDRIAFRLSGALSGQARLTRGESRCPRNLLKLQSPPYNCQPEGITRLPQVFNSGSGLNLTGRAGNNESRNAAFAHDKGHLPPFRNTSKCAVRHWRKRSNLKKDHLEVLASDA